MNFMALNFRRFLLSYKNNAAIEKVQINSQGWYRVGILLRRGDICQPMLSHVYGPGLLKMNKKLDILIKKSVCNVMSDKVPPFKCM